MVSERRRETEEASPSADAVWEKNLKETAPVVLARWKTAVYKGSSAPRRLAEMTKEMEVSMSLTTEKDFRPQKANKKRGPTSGPAWEVDVGKDWLSTQHRATGKEVTSDSLENNATRNTAPPWWVALETMKELENCLKKHDSGVSCKPRHWATQQKAKVNRLELKNQLGRTWENLLMEYFEEAMRTPSSALPLMANPFVRTARQVIFAWILVGLAQEVLTLHDKNVAKHNSGLSVARRKDASCFLRWIMSVITDNAVQVCHQKAMGSKTMERRISTVILNVYQNIGIEKENCARQSLENHGKLDEVRRFYNKKFEKGHDVHRGLARAQDYSKHTKRG